MKLKGDFELVDVDQFEKKVIAHGETEARLGKILEQSESVNYIFQFLMEETTEDDVVKNMVETFEADEEDGDAASGIKGAGKIKQAGINILKNPIIIGIFLGLVVSLLGLDFPTLVDRTVDNVAKMATPLALVTMGAGFEGRKALAKIKPTLAASFIKLVAQTAIFLPVAAAMGFTGEKIIGILIMLAAPTTPSCYIMAKNMKNDGVLTASIVVATTLLASFTLTGWIYLLKCVGLIG